MLVYRKTATQVSRMLVNKSRTFWDGVAVRSATTKLAPMDKEAIAKAKSCPTSL